MENVLKRKLAAILVADVVGYSRLIADDEEATLRRLEVFRALWQDCVGKYGGRIFNTAGDSVLAEFQSGVEAVRCALVFQAQAKTQNDGLVPRRQMHFRIGITIGDVVERGSDLLGDGVNIAARLQTLSGQGGICVSSWVREAVSNKLGVRFTDLGDQSVKNIPTPIRAYLVVASDAAAAAQANATGSKGSLGKFMSSWPGLAVVVCLAITGIAGAVFLASQTGPSAPLVTTANQPVGPASTPTAAPTPTQTQPKGDSRDLLREIDKRPVTLPASTKSGSPVEVTPPPKVATATPTPAASPPTAPSPAPATSAPTPSAPPSAEPGKKGQPASQRPAAGPEVKRGMLTEEAERLLKTGDRFKECDTCPEMVVVPRGDYTMGSSESEPGHEKDEAPAHKVSIGARLAVAVYPVTLEEYSTFAAVSGYRPGQGCRVFESSQWVDRKELSFRDPGFPQTSNHPVVCVNWNDAKAYTDWMSARTGREYRLPSEAEREFATRAGTTTAFWWGSDIAPTLASYDWSIALGTGTRAETRRGTHPVTAFHPNPWGLYQMHGNVSEWVEDCWNSSYRSAPADGSAWQSGDCRLRVLRGGSWGYAPKDLRAAYREGATLTFRNFNFGFRVVRVLR